MGTYPTAPRSAFLEWCQVHDPIFTAHAVEIGLTPAQATAFKTATTDGAAKLLAQETAKEASKVATQNVNTSFTTLNTDAGDVVRSIRAFAETSPDPARIYALAQIPPPADPTPAPPPAQPTDLTVTLDPTEGTITLNWKAANPLGTSGTAYVVRRKLPEETEFSFLGVSGKKSFVDTTLVAGPDSVQYTVQGQRADQTGPVSHIFTVNFGRLPKRDGKMVAEVTTQNAMMATPTTWNVEIPPPGSGMVPTVRAGQPMMYGR